MNKLSFSQITKYGTCPRSYKYHYVERLRERTVTSALAFGSAIDASLNAVLKDLQKNRKITVDYKAVFDNNWRTVEVNGKEYLLMDCTLVGYGKNDFQEELLDSEDKLIINRYKTDLQISDLNFSLSQLKSDLEHKKSIRNVVEFPENEHKILNIMNWLCMRKKAHYMLEAYVRDIVPQIEEVIDVQKKIELGSDGQDTVIGYIDAVVKLKGHDEPLVLDNKTASMAYDSDDVKYSQQLSLYCYTLGLKKAAYAVMLKNIVLNRTKICSKCSFDGSGSRHKTCNNELEGKRCNGDWKETFSPSAQTQLFVDEIPETTQHLIVDNVADINEAIHAKIFPQNLNACHNQFGQPCIYKKYCWEGNSNNLVKVEERK